MTLLSHSQLEKLVENDVITNIKPEYINATSIDITLGQFILVERNTYTTNLVSLRDRTPLNMIKLDLENNHFDLSPGRFILAQSEQIFNLPNNISAEYKLKSSMARIGLEHMNAGWCDAGWNGSVLTLEFKNMTQYHHIRLQKGDRIGQVVFFEHKPVSNNASYASRGRYNGNKTVSGIKP